MKEILWGSDHIAVPFLVIDVWVVIPQAWANGLDWYVIDQAYLAGNV